jgi:hypothetical protein
MIRRTTHTAPLIEYDHRGAHYLLPIPGTQYTYWETRSDLGSIMEDEAIASVYLELGTRVERNDSALELLLIRKARLTL